MSIKQVIWDRKTEGRIRQLSKRHYSDPSIRSIYLTSELHDELFKDRQDIKDIERFAQLEADLRNFISSKLIAPAYLKGLEPARNGVWEIRSKRPKPSIRVFCLFSEKDTMVCTHYVLRKDLGGPDSKEWRDEVERAKTIWRQLFQPYEPFCTDKADELFTGATNEYFNK